MAKHTRSANQEALLECLQAYMGRLIVEIRGADKKLEDKMMTMPQTTNRNLEITNKNLETTNKSMKELKMMFEIMMRRHTGKEPIIEMR
jgi:hypothetical protein